MPPNWSDPSFLTTTANSISPAFRDGSFPGGEFQSCPLHVVKPFLGSDRLEGSMLKGGMGERGLEAFRGPWHHSRSRMPAAGATLLLPHAFHRCHLPDPSSLLDRVGGLSQQCHSWLWDLCQGPCGPQFLVRLKPYSNSRFIYPTI